MIKPSIQGESSAKSSKKEESLNLNAFLREKAKKRRVANFLKQ